MELLALILIGTVIAMGWFIRGLAITARDRILAAEAQAKHLSAYSAAPDDYQIMTVSIPPGGGGVYSWRPAGDPCRLEECPPGPFLFRGELCIKSKYDQYGCTDLNGETVVIWNRNMDHVVQPVIVTPEDPDPFWIET